MLKHGRTRIWVGTVLVGVAVVIAVVVVPRLGAADPATVTGDEPADRDPGTGLWPSDHAGVVVELPLGER